MNFLIRAFQNVFFIVVGILIMPVFYKELGPGKIGEIAYIESWATIFSIFAGFGVARYGTREISKVDLLSRKEVYQGLRRFVVKNHIIISIIYLLLLSKFLFNEVDLWLLIISFLSVNRNLFNNDWFLEAIGKFNLVSIKNIVVKVSAVSILIITYLCSKPSFEYVYYALTGGFPFFCFLVTYFYFLKEKSNFTPLGQSEVKAKHNLYKELIPSLLLSNSYLLFFQADKILLGRYDLYQVGLYSFSERVILLIFPILMSLLIVSTPEVTKWFVKDKAKYLVLIEKMLKQVYTIAIPISVYLFFFSYEIVTFLGGEEFTSSTETLRFFSLMLLVMIMWRFVTTCIFYASSNEWSCFFIICFFGLINVIFKFFDFVDNANDYLLLTFLMHVLVIISLLIYSRFVMEISFRLSLKRLIHCFLVSLCALLLTFIILGNFHFLNSLYLITSGLCFFFIYTSYFLLIKDNIMLGFLKRS